MTAPGRPAWAASAAPVEHFHRPPDQPAWTPHRRQRRDAPARGARGGQPARPQRLRRPLLAGPGGQHADHADVRRSPTSCSRAPRPAAPGRTPASRARRGGHPDPGVAALAGQHRAPRPAAVRRDDGRRRGVRRRRFVGDTEAVSRTCRAGSASGSTSSSPRPSARAPTACSPSSTSIAALETNSGRPRRRAGPARRRLGADAHRARRRGHPIMVGRSSRP